MSLINAPFATTEVVDLAFARAYRDQERTGMFQERPNGVLLLANPLILPEPKYVTHSTEEELLQSLQSFREKVVCWATYVGDPDDIYLTTALSKLWLSWAFGLYSGEVPGWALPFGVTRYRGVSSGATVPSGWPLPTPAPRKRTTRSSPNASSATSTTSPATSSPMFGSSWTRRSTS